MIIDKQILDLGVDQLSPLAHDAVDRNRTSPFAFIGNRFEFRAVGSSQAIGFPLSILNAAVAEVLEETNTIIMEQQQSGKSIQEAMLFVMEKWINHAKPIIFDGDGYSEEWMHEAESRGLPNLRTTYDALKVLKDKESTAFIQNVGVMGEVELQSRYNVLHESYGMKLEIEYKTLASMVNQTIIPMGLSYKSELLNLMRDQRDMGLDASLERELLMELEQILTPLRRDLKELEERLRKIESWDMETRVEEMVRSLPSLNRDIVSGCNQLEEIIPARLRELPNFTDMLFYR